MPEGDTIHRTARTLDAALAGRRVTGFESPLVALQAAASAHSLVGQRIGGVEAQGKHLLLRFERGATLHSHMGMRGSWHLYRPQSAWRKPRRLARVILSTAEVIAVCFSAPVVALLSPSQLRVHPGLRRLGPDAVAPEFDPELARARLRERAELEIGVALLDQKAFAGVGNVFKSEVLFLCRTNPFLRVEALGEAKLDALVRTAATQLRRSVERGVRRTTTGLVPGNLWVYGRGGEPCRRCGTTVRRALQGEQRRSTYWCPRCQPVRTEPLPPPVPA
jgi:endonuclease VIII